MSKPEKQKYLWSPHVEGMSDGNNGWGDEQTYVCSSCGERSPYAQDYRSLVDLLPICYACHREERREK